LLTATPRPLPADNAYGTLQPMDYDAERAARRLYSDGALHLAILELVSRLFL